MRGIRISASKSADFYLAEKALVPLVRALDMIQASLHYMKEHYEEHITLEWEDRELEPIFHHTPVSSTPYHIELDKRGLFIAGSWFQEPGQLALVINRAIDKLKLH